MFARYHVAKAERLEATLQKLNITDDYEAIIWAKMHAATHLMNGALHTRGATPKDWDISHTWYLEDYPDPARLAAALDDDFRQALWAMTVYEGLRQTHVRGQGPYGPAIICLAQKEFDQIEAFCKRVIAESTA